MDTSETYIKMRRAAIPDLGRGLTTHTNRLTEIYRLWHLGNLTSVGTDDIGNWFVQYTDGVGNLLCCQLERQDQLQEMCGDYDKCLEVLYWWKECGKVLGSDKDYWGYDLDSFTSMEQLWLAFVMKQYNKTWNGEEWK